MGKERDKEYKSIIRYIWIVASITLMLMIVIIKNINGFPENINIELATESTGAISPGEFEKIHKEEIIEEEIVVAEYIEPVYVETERMLNGRPVSEIIAEQRIAHEEAMRAAEENARKQKEKEEAEARLQESINGQ